MQNQNILGIFFKPYGVLVMAKMAFVHKLDIVKSLLHECSINMIKGILSCLKFTVFSVPLQKSVSYFLRACDLCDSEEAICWEMRY